MSTSCCTGHRVCPVSWSSDPTVHLKILSRGTRGNRYVDSVATSSTFLWCFAATCDGTKRDITIVAKRNSGYVLGHFHTPMGPLDYNNLSITWRVVLRNTEVIHAGPFIPVKFVCRTNSILGQRRTEARLSDMYKITNNLLDIYSNQYLQPGPNKIQTPIQIQIPPTTTTNTSSFHEH